MNKLGFVPTLVMFVTMSSFAVGCDKDKPGSTNATPSATPSAAASSSAQATASASAAAAGSGSAGATAAAPGPAVTFKDVGLATPESVLYDDAGDAYLVSNINGKPAEADNNGFISKLTPDGKVETLKWIEGGKNKVTLNAPKGMAIAGDVLYVADLDTVRMFDKKTGAPTGEVKVAGATFLNDMTATSDGKVVVSDSGLKASATGLEPSGTDALYAIDGKAKKATPIAKTKDLGGPNGVLAAGDKTWVVTFGTGEVYSVDAKGKKADAQKAPKGKLDGIVPLPGGDVLVSSWEASAVYRVTPGSSEFKEVVADVKTPADIGWDSKRSRVLVPLFTENEVRAYDVKTTAR